MEYVTLTRNALRTTLATTLAALTLTTASGCLGVGKAFTTFGPSKEERIDADKEKKREEQYETKQEQETKQYENKQDLQENKQNDPKNQPKRNITPEFRIPAENCYNRRLDNILNI